MLWEWNEGNENTTQKIRLWAAKVGANGKETDEIF